MSNLTIIKGDTTPISVTLKDSAGVAIDITGATVFFTVKENKEKSDNYAVIKKDVTSHTDPTAGITVINLTAAETSVKAGSYFWDIQIKYDDGTIQSTTSGICDIVQDVTTRTT